MVCVYVFVYIFVYIFRELLGAYPGELNQSSSKVGGRFSSPSSRCTPGSCRWAGPRAVLPGDPTAVTPLVPQSPGHTRSVCQVTLPSHRSCVLPMHPTPPRASQTSLCISWFLTCIPYLSMHPKPPLCLSNTPPYTHIHSPSLALYSFHTSLWIFQTPPFMYFTSPLWMPHLPSLCFPHPSLCTLHALPLTHFIHAPLLHSIHPHLYIPQTLPHVLYAPPVITPHPLNTSHAFQTFLEAFPCSHLCWPYVTPCEFWTSQYSHLQPA